MGLAQSHAAFFQAPRHDAHDVHDDDGIDPLELLYKVERTFWRKEPSWLKPPPRNQRIAAGDGVVRGNQNEETTAHATTKSSTTAVRAIDFTSPMSPTQALVVIPTLMDEKWVTPLVALVDSIDIAIQSTALALLASIFRSDAAEDVFLKVGGVSKVMELLQVDSLNVKLLALEVVHALCSRNARMTTKFCEHGLGSLLLTLSSLGNKEPANAEIPIVALKVMRLVLACDPSSHAIPSSDMMPLLVHLTQSADPDVAQMAVACVRLSLSQPSNMAKILELRCVDALLKLVLPPNPSPCAIVQALALIAEENVSLFPKDLTVVTMTRILDTLRGGAKRSRTASACAYLFAGLCKSPEMRDGLCTEGNLSILSKLLVGGSPDVLKASTLAIGIAAHEGSSATKALLFNVEAPKYLLKLLDAAPDQQLTILLLFAIASVLDLDAGDSCGRTIGLVQRETTSPMYRQRMQSLSNGIAGISERFATVLRHSTSVVSPGSTFAAKIICGVSASSEIRGRVATNEILVQHMCSFLVDAAAELLSSLLVFFVECSSHCDPAFDNSTQFCELVSVVDRQLQCFVSLLDVHEPQQLVGLLTALKNFTTQSMSLRLALSKPQVIEDVLSLLTRTKEPALHIEVLAFLDELTSTKNQVAIANIFSQAPDRIANLLFAQEQEVLRPALNVMRRMFKHHNHPSIPSPGARRQLAILLNSDNHEQAVFAMRVWGNLLLHHDKQAAFAVLPNGVEALLRLIRRCHQALGGSPRKPATVKNCILAARTLYRGVADCGEMKRETATAPSFLVLFELFDDADERVMTNAVQTATRIAVVSSLKKYILVPPVLQKLTSLLANRDLVTIGAVYRVGWLKFVSALCRRDSCSQRILAEFGVLDAILMLVQSPAATLDQNILQESLDALAWMCTGEASVRKKIAFTPKLIDLSLKYVDCPRDALVASCLHLLQRLTSSDDCDEEKTRIRQAGGGSEIMRALHAALPRNAEVTGRVCALVRNLVTGDDINKNDFQRLGFNPAVVRVISHQGTQSNVKLSIRGLQALAAMCSGSNTIAKTCKLETLECENADELLRLASNHKETKLCIAWCEAAVSMVQCSPHNQKRLVDCQLTLPVVGFMMPRQPASTRLQITAARLLSFMAALPENRTVMMKEGGDAILSAIVTGLQSEVHDLQRYIALLIAHLATRNEAGKIRIGAGGATACLVDRLSSKQLNVVENVLQAIVKLGTHAGNKVKFGSRVCFEKLISLVHHDELVIRKGAVSTIAVLVEGNDVNKKFLLQCEASIVPELCALMKSSNGRIMESAMLILGELSQLTDQTLEISKFIDIVGILRMVENINPRIRRAALHTVLNLTKESFNKLRFGVEECISAMIACLQSEDMLIVELAMTCLANLSFLDANALLIARRSDSMSVFLKLAAASTSTRDYLSWNEARLLGLGKTLNSNQLRPTRRPAPSPPKTAPIETEEVEEDEIDDKLEPFVYAALPPPDAAAESEVESVGNLELLDFTSFPTRQTSVLEQTLLVVSNCAETYHAEQVVEKVAVKVVGQALSHPSELVKRCGCYVLAAWCKKDAKIQRYTTKQGILPVLIQLLNSPNLNVVEAAIYLLGKLAYYGDNHLKLMQLDFLTTIVQTILRKPSNLTHEGLMDRTIRVLGTLVRFPRVRQTIKSEEIIADILTQLLQIHRPLAKNTGRLILSMLEEDSLRFFLPKKTVMMLRVILTDNHGASPKTVRNILCVFERIATVEEHKTTIALEDSGEAVERMIRELRPGPTDAPNTDLANQPQFLPANSAIVLSLLTCISSTRKIALILHEKDVYAALPLYLTNMAINYDDQDAVQSSVHGEGAKDVFASRQMLLNTLVIARRMCSALGDRAGARLSHVNFSRLLIGVLQGLDSSTDANSLVPAYFECFTLLDRLSGYSRDQQVFAEIGASDVVLRVLQQWIELAEHDGSLTGHQASQRQQDRVDLGTYVIPIANVLLRMAEHDANKFNLVRSGGIPILLRCLEVALVNDQVRLLMARTLRLVCALGIAAEWFDGQDLVMPLFRFMRLHKHHSDLRLLCLGCLADILETSVLSRRHVIGQPQVLKFLLECLQNRVDDPADQVHFAINALECMSMEPELAEAMSKLGEGLLELVPSLLLVPDGSIARSTQYFAVEMIGYMASYGHTDKLGLDPTKIGGILRFLDFTKDETITGEVVTLTLWTLAHLVRRHPSNANLAASRITEWIAQSEDGVQLILCAGLTSSDQLGTNSSVTANMLSVLIAVCTSESAALAIQKVLAHHQTVCTSLSTHLEAIEREVNLPALRLLALCMVASGCQSPSPVPAGESVRSEETENWSVILHHLMEWMEVFARDPEQCPAPSLSDAFACLSQITAVNALGGEFRSSINRSGLAEIVSNAITFLDPKRRAADQQEKANSNDEDQDHERRQILINALNICGNLMEIAPAYCERFFLLNMPQAIESVLMIDDDEVILESLQCMGLLADWSCSRQLLFSSPRCVSRLTTLLGHKSTSIVGRITPLLVLLCSRIPSLPGLCTVEGVSVLCERLSLVTDWRNCDPDISRITEDCATIILSIFSNEESVMVIFDQVDVIGKMFDIVEKKGAPEIPLRILTKLSSSSPTHARLLRLLSPMCQLLDGTNHELGGTAPHLVLCILFNLFCRAEEGDGISITLKAGEDSVLQQLLPLSRWVSVPNVPSVRIAIKILHAYVSTPAYRVLLNDGKHIPALLRLVADSNDDVSAAAAHLLLTAITERQVEIAVTVEDGIAILVRTLQKTSKWHLQCLLLAILRNMCHDAEVPVLIMNEDGVSRLVHFVRERKGALFASDERLAHSCKILRYVSVVPAAGAATRIVEARGHVRLIELFTHQESATNDSERATTLEILSNLAASGEVSGHLTESKLHEYCLKWLVTAPQLPENDRDSLSPSRRLALYCLRSMCKHSKTAREEVANTASAKSQLIVHLESLLPLLQFETQTESSAGGVTTNALAVLMHMSKTQIGRHMIFNQSSPRFIERVCTVILSTRDQNNSSSSQANQWQMMASLVGVKLLGNVLSDLSPERFRVTWVCDHLAELLPLLQRMLADHEHLKLQLHALNLLCGSYDGDFYFPVSTDMLSDIINMLLISPTPRHSQQAEHVITKAFEQEEHIRPAIAGTQILEKLLIVFCQRVELQQLNSQQRCPLAPALRQVLTVSKARGCVVNPRFTSKIVTLLSTSSLASRAEACPRNIAPRFSNSSVWCSEGEDDSLTAALAAYLAYVFLAPPPSGFSGDYGQSPFQQTICDTLQSEVNSAALTALVLLLLRAHEQTCVGQDNSPAFGGASPLSSVGSNAIGSRTFDQDYLRLWNLVSHCLRGSNGTPQPQHIVTLLQDIPHTKWVYMLKDLFCQLAESRQTSPEPNRTTSGITDRTELTPVEAIIQALHVLSVIAINSPLNAETIHTRLELCQWSFRSVLEACMDSAKTSSSIRMLCEGLNAVACIRSGWGDQDVVQAFQHFEDISHLIQRWLVVFEDPNPLLAEARVSTLQLFLLLVSSGACVEDFKGAGVRGAIENNELIPADLKSVAITVLSLLGYNADLNVEFQLAIDRVGEAEAFTQRKEALAYLTNFLQLYTLTDESLQEVAIDQCMRHLVDDTNAIVRESSQPNGGSNDDVMSCIRDYLVCLIKLSHSRKFVEQYMRQWNTNALLAVCFSRRRALNHGGLRDCAVLSFAQITDGLTICGKISEALSAATSAGTLSDTTFLNAMVLLDDLPQDQVVLCERVMAVLAWSVENEDTFDLFCSFASRLRSVLRFVAVLSDAGMQSLTTILDAVTKRVPETQMLGELLTELLTCVYRNASKLKNGVREKLLLYILMILKRMGEDDLSACSIYEQSIQVILTNVHAPAEMPARCSWDLLGVLSELDPAIVTIFNFDGIQTFLKEFCGPTSASPSQGKGPQQSPSPMRRVLSTRMSALGAAERAALAASSCVASEATYRRLEALKCLSKSARCHDEVLQKIGEMPGIGVQLFRILPGAGNGVGTTDAGAALVVTSAAQEHAAHLIARISSQELFRASLLSQDHVSVLIESLESVHPTIVLHALEALFHLSEFAMCLDALVRNATVPVLAPILASPIVQDNSKNQERTELFVLGLLANMCTKSKVVGRRVVSSNLLPRLRVFLGSNRQQVQFFAVWIIKSVSKDSELVSKLHEQRIAEAIVEKLADYEPLKTQRKAFGALCNMITAYRIGAAFVDDEVLHALARKVVQAMHPLVVSPWPTAPRSLARALSVLQALAALSQHTKAMLSDEDDDADARALPLVLQLLDSVHVDVKLTALQVVSHWVEDNTDRDQLRRVLLVEAPLLSIVRAISDESGECLLVALTLLNTLLGIDDELKSKLSAMTNEVLLCLLPTLVPPNVPGSQPLAPLAPVHLRALNEALKSLVAMARGVTSGSGGSAVTPNQAAAINGAIDPLVELLRLSSASDNLRLNAIYLLVNFAGSSIELRPKMLVNGTMAACIRTLTEAHDDKLLQLCLLGMALLTSNSVDFSCVVTDLLSVVDVLLTCLTSKNASVQANAVWVVSNICVEARLKDAIVSREGATTLQTILHETMSEAASRASSSLVVNGPSRPLSSSQRIREYAPKAIKSLGFAPMTPGPSKS